MQKSVYLGFVALLLSASCVRQKPVSVPDEVSSISLMADTDAHRALKCLEVLEKKYRNVDEATRMRLSLLRIKAMDKADIPITEDSLMREVVSYYRRQDSPRLLLTALYYLAGTYRDKHDSPQALKTYLAAADYGESHLAEVDTVQLYYVYSQLSSVYDLQNNDLDAVRAYKQAIRLKKTVGTMLPIDYVVLGRSYKSMGATDSAAFYFKKAFSMIMERGDYGKHLPSVGTILNFFVKEDYPELAEVCFSWIRDMPKEQLTYNCCAGKGNYYCMRHQVDSAEVYLRYAMEHFRNVPSQRDCALRLYQMFAAEGIRDKALEYAGYYIAYAREATEEMAERHVTQVNNAYKYQKNQAEEAALRESALKAENRALWTGILCLLVLLFSFAGTWFYRKRFRSLKKAYGEFMRNTEKKNKQRMKLAVEVSDIRSYFLSIANDDTIIVPEEKWTVLFASVDKAFPEFASSLQSLLPTLSSANQLLLYLLKAGLKPIEAARVLHVDRSVISRRLKRLETKAGRPLKDI